MASEPVLRLDSVSKIFPGGAVGLEKVELAVKAGEFVSLLGPSGCGKTTSLRIIAGFERPSSGRVFIDEHDVTDLYPYDRPVNTVFQDYALFPHMSVEDNVGFGLSLRPLAKSHIRSRVVEALSLVGLANKLKARIGALSGGQRQRVALARAFVCEPRVLLLDEPLSALDAHLREQMQVELKRLQSQLGTTFVMVTHDQTEALSISDRIVVMNRGRIEQIAPPATLYDEPATRFVAGFIGTMNLVACKVLSSAPGGVRVAVGALEFEASLTAATPPLPGSMIIVGLRPEDVLVDEGRSATPVRLTGTVFHGRTRRLYAELADGTTLVVDAPRRLSDTGRAVGDVIGIGVRAGAARVLPDSIKPDSDRIGSI
jgi:spermidine/putrescine transport system ATP-binding protein